MEPESPQTAALEERLRSALTARSALVTAQSLRPAAPPRAASRFRFARRWPRVALVAGAVAAATAVAVLTLPFGSRTPADRHHAAGQHTQQPSTGQDQHRGPSAFPGRRITLGGLSLTVPPGWTAYQTNPGNGVCIAKPEAARNVDDCYTFGIQVDNAASFEVDPSVLNRADGWELSMPTTHCWDAEDSPDYATDEVASTRISARETIPVAGRQATYRAWRVTCTVGSPFTARFWWVPQGAFIRSYRLPEREAKVADQIVSSIALR